MKNSYERVKIGRKQQQNISAGQEFHAHGMSNE